MNPRKSNKILKMEAIKYYAQNNVPKEIEQVLNEMFYEKPSDPFGYLSDYFGRISNQPTISKFCITEGLRWGDGASVRIRILGTLAEVVYEKCQKGSLIIQDTIDTGNGKLADGRSDEEGLSATLNSLKYKLSAELVGSVATLDVMLEQDRSFRSMYEDAKKEAENVNSGDLASPEELRTADIVTPSPAPRKSIAQAGKKKGIRPCSAVPPSMTVDPALPIAADLSAFSLALCIAAANSTNPPTPLSVFLAQVANRPVPQMICPNGAPAVILDKPEQGIDMVLECLDQLQFREDFLLGLGLVSQGIFDQLKGKYEVITGAQKTPEETVVFYADLIKRYPEIRLMIDPFRKEDKQCWAALSEQIGPGFVLCTTNMPQSAGPTNGPWKSANANSPRSARMVASSGPSILQLAQLQHLAEPRKDGESETNDEDEAVPDEREETVEQSTETQLAYSGWLFNTRTDLECCLITELTRALRNLHGQGKHSIYDIEYDTNEQWPMDMAVGLGIHMVKLGGLNGNERTGKLIYWGKLLEREDELRKRETEGDEIVYNPSVLSRFGQEIN
ncbi:unnamed protein product [Calicophoron daubneyi]|uniref:Enolase 4 n=1 Tax=Calicophoron daubneyi TaxID=300641 RepID=A0AAV2TIK4_CALDB